MTIDPVASPRELIACPSVTPARGAVFDLLEAALQPARVRRKSLGDGRGTRRPTENMVAIRGEGPHFGFAGHLDVVPAGDGWGGDPFAGGIEDGALVGRGANDMKSAIAAFVAAAPRSARQVGNPVAADHRRRGRLCHLRHAAGSSTG